MPISAVIFDMDGLMLDTEPLYRIAWQQAAEESGHTVSDDLYFRLVGRGKAEAEVEIQREFGPLFAIKPFRHAVLRHQRVTLSAGPLPKKPGLDELLALLEARNIPKVVATSTERADAIYRLRAAGLLDRFGSVSTGDEVANGKPAPDIFLLAATRAATPPANCLVLEDSDAGVTAARNAGMQVFLVPDLKPPSPEITRLATATFTSLFDVARHLASLP